MTLRRFSMVSLLAFCWVLAPSCLAATPRVSGELRQWHKITLTFDGPQARETDHAPNPFLDYRMDVVFVHETGGPTYRVPGYFAADGNAAESGAAAGGQWRAHFAPDRPGRWTFAVRFRRGSGIAVSDEDGEPVSGMDGVQGAFEVQSTDKHGRDFRGQGRLDYVRERYLRFAGTGAYFLKAGADAPENLLGYVDFDGTRSNRAGAKARPDEAAPAALKTWAPHVRDWREGDPTWQGGRGKGLIGALNYLAGTGCNVFSFLTYNAGGDGDDVWPYVTRDDPLHFDCSKLDQWQIVFDHATALGLYLHFKLEETENDDNRVGDDTNETIVPTALDGGETGPRRRLYLRELVARFGHELALNWNLGEENTLTTAQQEAMSAYLRSIDAYHHPIVLHTFPNRQDAVYHPLLGTPTLTGVSLQNSWEVSHQRVLQWIDASLAAGRPWVVAHDEQNPHYTGVPPDRGWEGFDGTARPTAGSRPYTSADIRKYTLWGALMAGGAGVEYYFGYQLPQNDLGCQDWRSRDESWRWCGFALRFFAEQEIPFWRMRNADSLVGNDRHDNSRYCFAAAGEVYVVYLPEGGGATLDLGAASTAYEVRWFNPRMGGPLVRASRDRVHGPGRVDLGPPPADRGDDWVILVGRVADAGTGP